MCYTSPNWILQSWPHRCTEIAGGHLQLCPLRCLLQHGTLGPQKLGCFGGCTHQLPRVSEALAEHSLSDLCSTSRGFPKKRMVFCIHQFAKQTPKVNGTHQRMRTKRLIFEPHPPAPCTSSDGKWNMERDNLNCAWGPCWVLPRGLLDHKSCIMKMSRRILKKGSYWAIWR